MRPKHTRSLPPPRIHDRMNSSHWRSDFPGLKIETWGTQNDVTLQRDTALREKPMRIGSHFLRIAFFIPILLAAARVWAQGPPYQTDDPVPVDLHHYEFYIFGLADGTPKEMDAAVPAFEFNWGALPRVQLHAVLPFGVTAPLNHPAYYPDGAGPTHFGLTDMEFGARIAYIKESKHVPKIGTLTMFELPTGNAYKGLGVGKA